jgi:hypothetical protein
VAGPIYKLYMGKMTEAWYQLSEEEQESLLAKVEEARRRVGGKTVVAGSSAWSSEHCEWFGVEEFPDIEAVQKHAQELIEMDWYRHIDSMSVLGTEWEPS